MNWPRKLFSASNEEADIKAVLSVAVFAIAVLMYLLYGLKGLWVKWDMPASIRDVTVALIIGGAATAGSTLLNQKLGVGPTVLSPPPAPGESATKLQEPPSRPAG